ncbi:Ricin B lectin [Nosema bombycis CQ1]|uniref:Ricin B lectin n=1 Tax=Nosema bombycis (strain CQ1 / CVCC 102059) TaxID=578461 RepID=R0MFF5_NOSB1|nr:Ricin B lectin [Nosema bombycis CQ1]WGJ64408.1 ricin B lectin-like protein [Nosema bombycis]|eukprot:EOB11488.1 Ricin B lectin [Nosema bombycis CQ1]
MLVLIILILSIAKGLLIRHKASNKYLYPVQGSSLIYMRLTSDTPTAIDVILEPSKDGLVFFKDSANTGKSFDIANSGTTLILYSFHGGKNQQFYATLKGYNEFNIINNNLCLEHDSSSSNLLLKSCNNSENQIFEFVDPSKNIDVQYPKESANTASRFLNDSSNSHYNFSSKWSPSPLKTHSSSHVIHHHHHHGPTSHSGVDSY